MVLSMSRTNAILAAAKGYTIDRDGSVTGPSGKVLSLTKNSRGYRSFSIKYEKKTKSVRVHQLQAYTKYGNDLLAEGTEVRHLDGDKDNNSWDNIAIGTSHQNKTDQSQEVRTARARRAAKSLRKMTDEQVIECRRLHAEGTSQKALCEKYGVAKSTMSGIINRNPRQYAHI